MKLQVDGQQWRLRVDEDELQRLRDGHSLTNATQLPGDAASGFTLTLLPAEQADVRRQGDTWTFGLPAGSVEDYVQRLPCRKGLDFRLSVNASVELRLVFEVDVRDSVNRRGGMRQRR